MIPEQGSDYDGRSGEVIGTTRTLRNSRLLVDAVIQHVLDDPALLAVQVSRRLPMPLRVRAGRALEAVGRAGGGSAALGAVMAGDAGRAVEHLELGAGRDSRLHGEVAVLVDRVDLVREGAPASTRARALWSQGALSAALAELVDAGQGQRAHARRLRSELRLLEDGFELPVPRSGLVEPSPDAVTPLRVLHLVTNSLPHTQSGYAVRTHNILTALRQHGIESLALTRTGYPVMIGKPLCADEDVVDGIRYRRTLPPSLSATPQGRLEQEVDEAIRLVEKFRPHVLHATTDFRNALVAQAVSAATGIPWVLEVRGLLEKTWIASHRSPESRARAAESEKVARIAAAEARVARQAGAVVTLSRTMADVLRDRGVRAESITLVPNGVERSLLDEQLSPAQARARIDLPLPAGALAVGAVSALVDYEGFDTLLRAVAALLQGSLVPEHVRDRLHVVLVGDGVSAPALSRLARELGIADRLHMPGRVPRDRARDWVQALDVVVVPRRDLEVSRTVTPQKPIEAMALARPVVVSDLPALRETIENGAGHPVGVLVTPDDPQALGAALAALLADPARRAALGNEGRAAAAERTWTAMMGRYEEAYRSVLGGES